MPFTNLYYKRTAGTAKSCYICCKPATTVLATINTTDFIYTCPAHLTDRGFATPVGEAGDATQGSRKLGLTSDEIAKVKEEWEEVQRKKEKVKEKSEEKSEEKKGEEKKAGEKTEGQLAKGPQVNDKESGSAGPAAPSHERYTLHRDYFAMRLAEHRKRRQTAQAKELGPRLPSAPSGAPL